MFRKTAKEIIRFNGDFPNNKLDTLRALAEIIRPWEGMEDENDPVALFNCMHEEGIFTAQFFQMVEKARDDIIMPLLRDRHRALQSNQGHRQHHRTVERLGRQLFQIRDTLSVHAHQLTHELVQEILESTRLRIHEANMQDYGATEAHRLSRVLPCHDVFERAEENKRIYNEKWFELATTIDKTRVMSPPLSDCTPENKLWHVHFTAGKTIRLPLPPNFTERLGPDYWLEFMPDPTGHPFCAGLITLNTPNGIATACELSRPLKGLSFLGCSFTSVENAFTGRYAAAFYMWFKHNTLEAMQNALHQGMLLEHIPEPRILLTPNREPEDSSELLFENLSDEDDNEAEEEAEPCVPASKSHKKSRLGALKLRKVLAAFKRLGATWWVNGNSHYCVEYKGVSYSLGGSRIKKNAKILKTAVLSALEEFRIPERQFVIKYA